MLGRDDRQTAFAVVNAAWRRSLADAGVTLVEDDSADVLIHHDYSERFGDAALPAAGRRVAVRPWDFGPYPPRWAEVVEEQYDELWVFTEWGRECAIAGGIAPTRVRVIPLGVDITTMTPEGPRHEITEHASTTFLFVGAAVHRKGIDIVLRAFLDAFDEHDDVQLVVKDHTRDLFYQGLTQRDEIVDAAGCPGAPTIRYLDEYLSAHRLAALYRGADALVLPSRAEGWALPAVEAMACGTAAIVPAFGAFLTYSPSEGAMLVPSKRIRVPLGQYYTTNTLGFEEHVDRVDFCETAPAALARTFLDVARAPAAVRQRRARAARATAEQFSWTHSAAAIVRAISELITRIPARHGG